MMQQHMITSTRGECILVVKTLKIAHVTCKDKKHLPRVRRSSVLCNISISIVGILRMDECGKVASNVVEFIDASVRPGRNTMLAIFRRVMRRSYQIAG